MAQPPIAESPNLCNDTIMNKTTMLDSQATSAAIYKGLFTDDEWVIIDRALSEYQDHFEGDDTYEEIVYNRVVDKIATIFRLTANN